MLGSVVQTDLLLVQGGLDTIQPSHNGLILVVDLVPFSLPLDIVHPSVICIGSHPRVILHHFLLAVITSAMSNRRQLVQNGLILAIDFTSNLLLAFIESLSSWDSWGIVIFGPHIPVFPASILIQGPFGLFV